MHILDDILLWYNVLNNVRIDTSIHYSIFLLNYILTSFIPIDQQKSLDIWAKKNCKQYIILVSLAWKIVPF